MKENLDKIKEVNKNISEALAFWQYIMLEADAREWAYLLEYTDEDLLNALYIFNHVAQNKAIKSEFITHKNAIENMEKFKAAVKECFGFDTVELTKKVLKK